MKVKFLDETMTLEGTNGYRFKTRNFFMNTSYDEVYNRELSTETYELLFFAECPLSEVHCS